MRRYGASIPLRSAAELAARSIAFPRPAKSKRAPSKTARSMPKRSSAPLVEQIAIARPATEHELRSALFEAHAHLAPGGMARATSTQAEVAKRIFFDVLNRSTETLAWRIRLEELTTSQNVLARKYGNVHKYKKLIASLAEIFWAAMVQGKIPKAAARRRLTITRFVRSERFWLDRGNLVGGCKPLLDAAVKAGLIRDDREADLDDHYRQVIDRDERTEILIEDIPLASPP